MGSYDSDYANAVASPASNRFARRSSSPIIQL
jgi:hypothetical protein